MNIEIQRKYMQIQALEERIKSFMNEKENVENAIEEIHTTITSLENLKKDVKETINSLGSGVLIFTIPRNVDEVLLNIGAEIYVRKKRIEAIAILRERLKELVDYYNAIGEQLTKLVEQYEQAKNDLEKLIQQQQRSEAG